MSTTYARSLQSKRRASNLILAYKLLNGFIDVDAKAYGQQLTSSNTRGNDINLYVQRAMSSCVAKTFSNRVLKVCYIVVTSITQIYSSLHEYISLQIDMCNVSVIYLRSAGVI